jgi:hypothetical protein
LDGATICFANDGGLTTPKEKQFEAPPSCIIHI